jgi:hypothetical protein
MECQFPFVAFLVAISCFMTHAVGHLLLTLLALDRLQDNRYGICDSLSGKGIGFSLGTSEFLQSVSTKCLVLTFHSAISANWTEPIPTPPHHTSD